MDPVAIILTAVAAFGGYAALNSSKKKEEERKMKEEEEKKRQKEYAEAELAKFKDWLTPVLVIDSNIWMNEKYESFFHCLRYVCLNRHKIELFGVQFDEITNIKKSTNFGDERNRRARIAIERIETLQEEGSLTITPITMDASRRAYADPTIVKILAQKSEEGLRCTFISDDKELRVRVRQHLMNIESSEKSSSHPSADGRNWEIVDLQKQNLVCIKISGILRLPYLISSRKLVMQLSPESIAALAKLDSKKLIADVMQARKKKSFIQRLWDEL